MVAIVAEYMAMEVVLVVGIQDSKTLAIEEIALRSMMKVTKTARLHLHGEGWRLLRPPQDGRRKQLSRQNLKNQKSTFYPSMMTSRQRHPPRNLRRTLRRPYQLQLITGSDHCKRATPRTTISMIFSPLRLPRPHPLDPQFQAFHLHPLRVLPLPDPQLHRKTRISAIWQASTPCLPHLVQLQAA